MDENTEIPIQSFISKGKPPRLKSSDRTISVQIDNYTPASTSIVKPNINVRDRWRTPILLRVKNENSKIFYLDENINNKNYELILQDNVNLPKYTYRRSDTLNINKPSQTVLRKTHSFHVDEQNVDRYINRESTMDNINIMSRQIGNQEKIQTTSFKGDKRRNCRMHRSLIVPNREKLGNNSRKNIVKYSSFNGETYENQCVMPKNIKINSNPDSVEETLYRVRSTRRNRREDDVYRNYNDIEYTRSQIPNINSEIMQKRLKFRQRGSQIDNNVYSHPSKAFAISFQDSVTPETQSFPKSNYYYKTENCDDNNLSPNVKLIGSKLNSSIDNTFIGVSLIHKNTLYNSSDIRKHYKNALFLHDDDINRSIDLKSSHSLEQSDKHVNNTNLTRSFRQRQHGLPNSEISSPIWTNMSNTLEKKNLENKIIYDQKKIVIEDEINHGRKKVICIIVTCFLSLVFTTIFIIVITLTQVNFNQRQTASYIRKSSSTRDMPLHYNGKKLYLKILISKFYFLSLFFFLILYQNGAKIQY